MEAQQYTKLLIFSLTCAKVMFQPILNRKVECNSAVLLNTGKSLQIGGKLWLEVLEAGLSGIHLSIFLL
jgi:hypothetical protein